MKCALINTWRWLSHPTYLVCMHSVWSYCTFWQILFSNSAIVFFCFFLLHKSPTSDIIAAARVAYCGCWCSAEGVPEPMSLLEPEQLTPGMTNTTNAVIARLKDFHDLLRSPPQVNFCFSSSPHTFRDRYVWFRTLLLLHCVWLLQTMFILDAKVSYLWISVTGTEYIFRQTTKF